MPAWLRYSPATNDGGVSGAFASLVRHLFFTPASGADGAAMPSATATVNPAQLRAQMRKNKNTNFRSERKYGESITADSDLRQVTFTFAVIELAAKLARADGPVVQEEFIAFREMFPMPESQSNKVRRLFKAACEENTSAEYYAKQITAIFPERKELMRELAGRLFAIAAADGAIKPEEKKLLKKIVIALGLSGSDYRKMLERYVVKASSDPYKLLGVSPRSDYGEVKKRYRSLVRRYHPDRLATATQNVSRAQLLQAERQTALVNAAYDKILRQKGWK